MRRNFVQYDVIPAGAGFGVSCFCYQVHCGNLLVVTIKISTPLLFCDQLLRGKFFRPLLYKEWQKQTGQFPVTPVTALFCVEDTENNSIVFWLVHVGSSSR